MITTHLDSGFPLKSAISRALQNLMLSGISGMSVTGVGVTRGAHSLQELKALPATHRLHPRPALGSTPFRDTSSSTSCMKLATSGGKRWISLSLRPSLRRFSSRKKGCGQGMRSGVKPYSRNPPEKTQVPRPWITGALPPPGHTGTQGSATSPSPQQEKQEKGTRAHTWRYPCLLTTITSDVFPASMCHLASRVQISSKSPPPDWASPCFLPCVLPEGSTYHLNDLSSTIRQVSLQEASATAF